MADQGGIQLLPETRKKIEIKIPGENRWIYSGIAALGIVLAAYAGLTAYAGSLQTQVDEIDTSISTLKRDKRAETELLDLGKQTAIVSQFLTNHIFWTKALGKLSNDIAVGVQLRNFNASVPKQNLLFRAFAPTYTVIARQVAALAADDGLTDIGLSNAKSANTGGLEFTVDLTFDPAKYLKKP